LSKLTNSYKFSEQLTTAMLTSTETKMLGTFAVYAAYSGTMLSKLPLGPSTAIPISLFSFAFGIIATILISRYRTWKQHYLVVLRTISEYYLRKSNTVSRDHLPAIIHETKVKFVGPIDVLYFWATLFTSGFWLLYAISFMFVACAYTTWLPLLEHCFCECEK